jgi:hypothetical protein
VARPAPAPIERAPPQPPAVAGPVAVAERDGSPAVTRFGLGISAEGAAGIGGPAAAVGASLHGVVPVATSWLLGVGLGLRAGSIPALPGSRVVVGTLGAGVEWWPAALQAGRIASLGLRADALAMRHQVSASVIAGRSETEGRFQAGVDVMAQLGLRIGARLQVLAAAGAEETFGTTEIRTGNPPVTVATIPALRLTAELGVRVGF